MEYITLKCRILYGKLEVYSKASEELSSSMAKNIVKNAGNVITIGLGIYDGKKRWNRADKDKYIRAMIMESGLQSQLDKVDTPQDLFIIMTYVEGKLDSYGEDNYKLYNKYFGGYSGLSDYTDNYGISIWDKLTDNVENKKREKEEVRSQLKEIAKKLLSDFEKDIK